MSNCSGYTVASISTNIATVAATGKTNADLVVSYLAGKDCRFIRVTKNSEICKQSDSNMAIKEETIEKKNTRLEIEINGKYYSASVIKEPLYDPSGSKMRS